jgi:hypothetical protein
MFDSATHVSVRRSLACRVMGFDGQMLRVSVSESHNVENDDHKVVDKGFHPPFICTINTGETGGGRRPREREDSEEFVHCRSTDPALKKIKIGNCKVQQLLARFFNGHPEPKWFERASFRTNMTLSLPNN